MAETVRIKPSATGTLHAGEEAIVSQRKERKWKGRIRVSYWLAFADGRELGWYRDDELDIGPKGDESG